VNSGRLRENLPFGKVRVKYQVRSPLPEPSLAQRVTANKVGRKNLQVFRTVEGFREQAQP
jgi:hypothetical protein